MVKRRDQLRSAIQTASAIAGCLLSIPLVWWAWHPWAQSLPMTVETASSSRRPFDAAMHQAWEHWLRDHDVPARMPSQPHRLNPNGSLHRARTAALQALALAQSTLEESRARFMLARIADRAGDHTAELKQARCLVVLQPRNRDALLVLRRAAKCNGLELLTREVQGRLEALPGALGADRAP